MPEAGPRRRRVPGLAAAGAAAIPATAIAQSAPPTLRPNQPGPYDIVVAGGRVVDPENRRHTPPPSAPVAT